MENPNEEQKKDLNQLSNNLGQIEKQVKTMKFAEMYERMKVLQYEKNKTLEKNVILTKENEELKKNLEEIKKDFLIFENKQKESSKKISDMMEEISKNQEILKIKREEIRFQKKNANDFLEILEYNNSKSYANIKLINQLYKKDESITNTIKNYVMKNIKKYNKIPNPLKRELKKNSLFLEEFIKLIVYLRNSFQEKNQKINELHKSAKISQIMENNKNENSIKNEILSESDNKPYQELNETKLNDLAEQVQYLYDKILANEKVENLSKTDSLKDKLQKYREKNQALLKKENEMKEIFQNYKLSNKKKEDLLERLYKMLRKTLPVELKKRETLNLDPIDIKNFSNNNNFVSSNKVEALIYEEDNFDYIGYEDKCKISCQKLKFFIDELKDSVEAEKKQIKESLIPIQNEKTENIYKLQDDKKKLERDRDDFKEKYLQCVKKVEFFKKQNKELLRNYQKKVVFESTREKILEDYSLKKFDDLKIEIEKKSAMLEGLIKVNNKMTERLKNLQSERIAVLRDKQHCEDLYNYFNKKSTDIFIMNEKLTKIVKENKKLRRFIEELFNLLKENVKISTQDLLSSEKDFDYCLDEFKNTIFMASLSKEEFDVTLFNKYLLANGKDDKVSKRNKKNNKNDGVSKEIKNNKINEEYKKVQEALNKLDQNNVKDRDIDILKTLNSVLVENKELKIILNTQKVKYRNLNKDLLQYKKKSKMISLMEPKIEKMVSQNLELKKILLNIQSVALQTNEVNSNRAINYNNNVEVSGELLEKLIEKIRKENMMKKNLTMKVHILQQRKAEVEVKMEKTINEYEIELTNFLNVIKDKNKIIVQNEEEINRLKKFESLIDGKNNEITNLTKDVESHLNSIKILEDNLTVLNQKASTDKDKLKGELDLMMNKNTNKASEQADLIDDKFRMENQLQSFKEKIMNLNELVASKDNYNNLQKEKLKTMKIENQKLIDENVENEKNLKSKSYNLENLEKDHEKLLKEIEELKKNNNSGDENAKFVSDERKIIFDKLNEQFKEKILSLENELYDLKTNGSETVFDIERKNKEISDLKAKIKMKNKQLIQFNSYINSLSDSKNPNISKISRILVQNKSLLREIEQLRNKNKQLQNLYKNLQNSIDTAQISPPSQENKKHDQKINSLKNNFDTLYVDNYNLKVQFDVLVNCYEEKLSDINKDYEKLNNDLIKEKNLSLKNDENYLQEKNVNDDLKMDIENLKEENLKFIKINNGYLKENYQLKNKIKKLKISKDFPEQNNDDLDEKISELNNEKHLLEAEIENLKEELNQKDRDLVKNIKFLDSKKEKINELEKKMRLYNSLEEENSNMKILIEKLKNDKIELSKDIKFTKESTSIKNENLLLENENSKLIKKIEEKENEIKLLNNILKESKSNVPKNENNFSNEEVNKLKNEKSILEEKIQNLEKEIEDLKKKTTDEGTNIGNSDDLLKEKERNLALEEKISKKEKDNFDLKEKILEKEKLMDDLKKMLESNSEANNDEKLVKIIEQEKIIEKKENEIKNKEEKILDQEKLIKIKDKKINQLEETIKDLEKNIDGGDSELNNLIIENKKIKDKLNNLENEKIEVEEEKQKLEKEIEKLKEEKKKLENSNDKTKDRFRYKDEKIEELNQKWKEFLKKEIDLTKKIENLKEKNSDLNNKITELEKTIKEPVKSEGIKQFIEEIKIIKEKNLNFENENIELELKNKINTEKINNLTKENILAEKMIEVVKIQNKDLENEFAEFDEILADIEGDPNIETASKDLIELYKKKNNDTLKKYNDQIKLNQKFCEDLKEINKINFEKFESQEKEIVKLRHKLISSA